MEFFYCYGYGRLSREDGGKLESDSIKNQRDLIHDYVAKHPELKLVMEGYDDGYTGTNFDRPHFQEMMAAIEAGKVNCVIVKDLSRFGRNHIDGGRYIAKLFPSLGVRFIAINDSYDTAHLDSASSFIMPVKNLFNDSFCRDTSEKIRSHLDVKRRNGDFIGSFAPFGYAKDADDKNRLVIDPDAAQVVREIFARRIAGQSCKAIADELNSMGVLSPMEYKRARGMNYKSGYSVHGKALWAAVTVRRILRNELYLGVLEQGKRTTPNYKVKTVVERPPEDWMRVENSHEAIVSREDFELAARLMDRDTRMAPGARAVYPLAGLVCCGDCMGPMARKTSTYGKKTYAYYICATHRENKSVCSPHSVSETKLEAAVLEGINLHIQTVVELSRALEAANRRPMRQVKAGQMESRLNILRGELAKKQATRDSLYRRYAAGEITREDFYEFKRIFTQDCEDVERAVEAHQRQMDELLANTAPDSPWIEHFRRFGHLDGLTRDNVVRLVDRVLVYEGGRAEIVFRYQEQFEQAMAVVQASFREAV